MNTKEVLRLYKIKMANVIVDGRNHKSFIGGNHLQSFFDVSYNDTVSINEAIDLTQHFIEGNTPPLDVNEAEFGSEVGALPYPYIDGVRFHHPVSGEIEQTIPLAHFKIIAEAWRDFLSLPPYQGRRV